MTEYSRAAFREWLTALPADQPIGIRADGECLCPVAVFLKECGSDEGSILNGMAHQLDCDLVDAIDKFTDELIGRRAYDAYRERDWSRLTPAHVIAIIDELEAAA